MAENNLSKSGKRGFLLLFLYAALMISLTFSIQWIYPLLYQKNHSSTYYFVPIREYSHGYTNDKYYYYSHVKEILYGHFPSNDPVSFEHKNETTPHVSYSFSLLLSSLGGFFNKKTEDAYYFNYIVFPFLNFFLSYILLRNFIKGRVLALAIAVWNIFYYSFPVYNFYFPFHVIVNAISNISLPALLHFKLLISNKIIPETNLFDRSSFDYMFRTPNILVTNIVVLIIAVQLYRILELNNRGIYDRLLLSLLLIAATFTSAPVFIVSFALCIPLTAAYLIKERDKRLGILLGGISILAISGLYFVYRLVKVSPDNLALMTQPLWQFSAKVFIANIAAKLPFLLIMYLLKYPKKFFLALSETSLLAIFTLLSLKGAWVADNELYAKGFMFIYKIFFFSALISAIEYKIKKHGLRGDLLATRVRNIFDRQKIGLLIKAVSVFIIIMMPLAEFLIQTKYIQLGLNDYNDKNFKELYEWSRKNFTNSDVAVTLDADLITNLVVYSPVNMYLPSAILSPTSNAERMERFLEIAKYYGLNTKDLHTFLDRILPVMPLHVGFKDKNKDFMKIRMSLFDLVMYYYKNLNNPLSSAEKRQFLTMYKQILSRKKTFSFRNTYLIVSKFDLKYIKRGSQAFNLIDYTKPVFANKAYAVYKICQTGPQPLLAPDK